MRVPVWKYHALGNDYLVVEGPLDAWPAERVARICDRHRGVGSDGILVHVPSERADVGVRVVNPDGSRAETSGNGLRIFARWAVDVGRVAPGAFTIETVAGVRDAIIDGSAIAEGTKGRVEVSMGPVSFGAVGVPIEAVAPPPPDMSAWPDGWIATEVQIGNPHLVVVGPEPSEALATRVGHHLETSPRWPHRTNVQIATATSSTVVRAVVWERGAGWTLASGSSACAVAAALHALGRTAERVTVEMPGGVLWVDIDDHGYVSLAGDVTPVLQGAWSDVGDRCESAM